MRGVTFYTGEVGKIDIISIHTPHAGSDGIVIDRSVPNRGFQSTLPMRGVTVTENVYDSDAKFQSTLPMRGVTSTEQLSCAV